jgi:hypothetical protein
MQMKHPRCRWHEIDSRCESRDGLELSPSGSNACPIGTARTRLTRSTDFPWGTTERRSPRRRAAALHGRTTRSRLSERSTRLLGRDALAADRLLPRRDDTTS